MGNKKEGTTRKEFLKRTTRGTLGMVVDGFLWPVLTFGKTYTQSPKVLSKIAFGSCAKQNKSQPIWDAIASNNPDVFLFLGDNIYGDTNDMEV